MLKIMALPSLMAFFNDPATPLCPQLGSKKADNPVIGFGPYKLAAGYQTTTAVPLILTISMLPFCPTTS